MKTVKRNAVIITVMLFVCAAVYLNWSYNRQVEEASGAGDEGQVSTLEEKPGDDKSGGDTSGESGGDGGSSAPGKAQTLENTAPDGGAGLYYSVANDSESGGAPSPESPASEENDYSEYFAQVRLERSQARDEAAATLTAVAEAEGASQETVDGALKAMTELAQNAVKESELESLIRAKGFIDCVVYLSDGGAKVTVAAEDGLDQASVAKITDVVVTQAGIPAGKLTVTEIK